MDNNFCVNEDCSGNSITGSSIQNDDSETQKINLIEIPSDETETGEVPYRFFIIISFSFLSFCNGMQWVTISPISNSFKKNYDLSTFLTNLPSILFMIFYPIVSPLASYIIEKNIKTGIVISASLNIMGAVIKCYTNSNIIYLYIGQTFSAIAQPFFQSSHSKIATTWFREKRRALVSSISCSSNSVGIIIGYTFPTFFVDENMGKETYKNEINNYLYFGALINIILCVPALLFFRNSPPIPSSSSQQNKESLSLRKSLIELFKNTQFIKLLFNQSLIVSYSSLYTTCLIDILSKYDVDEKVSSLIGSITNFVGLIGVLIFSIQIDKSKKYRKWFIKLNFLSLVFQILFAIFLELSSHSVIWLILSFVSYNLTIFFLLPMMNIGFDFASQLTYPIGESVSGGLLATLANIASILSIHVSDYMRDNLGSIRYLTNIIGAAILFFSLVMIILLREDLKRSQRDKEGKNEVKEYFISGE